MDVKLIHVRWSRRSQWTHQSYLCIQRHKGHHLKVDNSTFEINDTCMRRPKCLDGIKSWRKEANGDKETFDGSDKALLGLHAWVYKETSCAPRLTIIKRISTRKGSRKIRVLMKILSTRKDPLHQGTNVNSTLL